MIHSYLYLAVSGSVSPPTHIPLLPDYLINLLSDPLIPDPLTPCGASHVR
jgi:hypothetical protein